MSPGLTTFFLFSFFSFLHVSPPVLKHVAFPSDRFSAAVSELTPEIGILESLGGCECTPPRFVLEGPPAFPFLLFCGAWNQFKFSN